MGSLTSILAVPWLGMPVGVWLAFVLFVLVLIAVDLGLFHRKPHEISLRASIFNSILFIGLGLAFTFVVAWLYYYQDPALIIDPQLSGAMKPIERARHAGELFLTGLVIEQSLSLDNIFIISLVFGFFDVPRRYQHSVLFWGIVGVILMRGALILLGAALIVHLHWVLYIFAAFLIFVGLKMLFSDDEDALAAANPLTRAIRRVLRVTDELYGGKFVVMAPDPVTGEPVLWFTRLFLCLATIELIDVIFALDSVPAIFSITQEPFIVYASNIFAILGLRSLYFVLSAMVHRFQYLSYALALVLIFIGKEIFLRLWGVDVPIELSLGVTVSLLVGGVLYSLWRTRRDAARMDKSA
jgi:tellurite resistance protein TerC